MYALLASFALFAAAETAPAPVKLIPDPEVPQYLKANQGEVVEWGKALRQLELGQQRLQQGNSILNAPRITTSGAFQETPEQAKARAQKIIDEGRAQMSAAAVTLDRLRRLASTRYTDLTKTVNLTENLTQSKLGYCLNLASVRLQKIARDGGYKNHHIIGSVTVLSDGKILKTPAVTESLRAAWTKADANGLSPVPEGGYSYKVGSNSAAPQLAKDWKVLSPRNTTVLWVEVYGLTKDNSLTLLLVRMADAYTMRLIGSEMYLTTFNSSEVSPKVYTAAINLRDEKSFLPRLASSGDRVVSYDRTNSLLGNALLKHLCLGDSKVAVGASQSLVDILGGDAPSLDGAMATWKISSLAGGDLDKNFKISCEPNGADSIEVGQLSLKLEEQVKPRDASKATGDTVNRTTK
jgi:hypothetical protein